MASTSTKAAATKSILKPSIALKGHGGRIWSMSYFPDGQRMISGSEDKTTRQWDLEAGKEIEEVRDVCEKEVHAVAVSRNGRWIATGSDSGELKACEVETGIVKTFEGHSLRITCIDISADNTWLASGSGDKTVRIWNLDTGKLVAGPFKSEGLLGAVRFSPDSKKLAVKSWGGWYLEVWDVQSQKMDVRVGEQLPGSNAPVFWTNNNKTIITAFSFTEDDNYTTIYEFDASTLETVGTPFKAHSGRVSGLTLSFDNALLASASKDNTIKLWVFESRQLLASFHVQKVSCVVLPPNSRQIAYTTYTHDDHNIYICDIPPKFLAQARKIARTKSNLDRLLHSHATRLPAGHCKPPIYTIPTVPRPLPSNDSQQPAFRRLSTLLRFSPGTNSKCPGRKDQSRDPLDFPATLPLPSNRIHGESAPSTSLLSRSTFFNSTHSSSCKGKQKAHEPKRKHVKVFDVPLGQATYADAVGVDDGYRPYVVFFCLSWFQKKKKKPEPQPVVYDDEFDGDDEEEENVSVPVAVPPSVQHEEIELKTMVSQPQPEAGPSRLAVTNIVEDGQRMISGGSSAKIAWQWDVKVSKEDEEARNVCEEEVWAVAVSRDGRWIVTAGGDVDGGVLKACEVETGTVRTFEGHLQKINCVDISVDNTLLASGADNFTARILNLDTGKLVADSKKLALKSDVGRCIEVWDIESQKLDTNNTKTIFAAFSFTKDAPAHTMYDFGASTSKQSEFPLKGTPRLLPV
ncbi:hypothetical protein EDD22DRAFT_961087 [Suillus occidentalis]|nr:hypothetical protein EDD22DRAFT_961087 [Suillus occidentalis]